MANDIEERLRAEAEAKYPWPIMREMYVEIALPREKIIEEQKRKIYELEAEIIRLKEKLSHNI